MTREALIAEIDRLTRKGLTAREIGEAVGLSRSGVQNIRNRRKIKYYDETRWQRGNATERAIEKIYGGRRYGR